MLFAALVANDWVIIIPVIVTGILQILQMILSHFKGVKQTENVNKVAEKVEAVRINSNGLTERLVETTKRESYAQGLLDGRIEAAVGSSQKKPESVQ